MRQQHPVVVYSEPPPVATDVRCQKEVSVPLVLCLRAVCLLLQAAVCLHHFRESSVARSL